MIDRQNMNRAGNRHCFTLIVLTAFLASGPMSAAENQIEGGAAIFGTLDQAYVDASFGFSIRPPAGCTLTRRKTPAEDQIEICRFIDLPHGWSLSVRFSEEPGRWDAEKTAADITAYLTKRHGNAQATRSDSVKIASADGLRYAASFVTDQTPWLRQQAVVQLDRNRRFDLVFVTPVEQRDTAEKLFDQIVDSFEILRSAKIQQRVDEAMKQGTQLLASVADGKVKLSERVGDNSYLLVIRQGEEIGFVETSQRVTTMDKHLGVQILQQGWLFNTDGSASYVQENMFVADDLSYDRWEKGEEALRPTKPGDKHELTISMETGLRQDDKLIVAYPSESKGAKRDDRVIEVPKSYVAGAWQILLGRVVDLSTPELYAFSQYDSDRRGLALQTFEVVGPAQVLVSGQRTSAVKLNQSEGLIGPANEIYVDAKGNILRIMAGPIEMASTSKQYVEQKYAGRVEQIRKLFTKKAEN